MDTKYTTKIIRHLEKLLSGGSHQSQIFDDWTDAVNASLKALPQHLKSSVSGMPFEDTPETQELFKRLRIRYDKTYYWEAFGAAFAELLQSAEDGIQDNEYQDTLGSVYMEWGIPNKFCGQFFTPYDIAKMMAEVTYRDVDAMLRERIIQAAEKDTMSQAMLVAGLAHQTPADAANWFYTRVLPAVAPHVDPITVQDPCCGSGVMLLASATIFPRWAIDFGIVQFWGMDIDYRCVKMAEINMMLYGLNSYGLRCALAATPEELTALPEPLSSAYTEAQQAAATGNQERVLEISEEIRFDQYKQPSLLDCLSI